MYIYIYIYIYVYIHIHIGAGPPRLRDRPGVVRAQLPVRRERGGDDTEAKNYLHKCMCVYINMCI